MGYERASYLRQDYEDLLGRWRSSESAENETSTTLVHCYDFARSNLQLRLLLRVLLKYSQLQIEVVRNASLRLLLAPPFM